MENKRSCSFLDYLRHPPTRRHLPSQSRSFAPPAQPPTPAPIILSVFDLVPRPFLPLSLTFASTSTSTLCACLSPNSSFLTTHLAPSFLLLRFPQPPRAAAPLLLPPPSPTTNSRPHPRPTTQNGRLPKSKVNSQPSRPCPFSSRSFLPLSSFSQTALATFLNSFLAYLNSSLSLFSLSLADSAALLPFFFPSLTLFRHHPLELFQLHHHDTLPCFYPDRHCVSTSHSGPPPSVTEHLRRFANLLHHRRPTVFSNSNSFSPLAEPRLGFPLLAFSQPSPAHTRPSPTNRANRDAGSHHGCNHKEGVRVVVKDFLVGRLYPSPPISVLLCSSREKLCSCATRRPAQVPAGQPCVVLVLARQAPGSIQQSSVN